MLQERPTSQAVIFPQPGREAAVALVGRCDRNTWGGYGRANGVTGVRMYLLTHTPYGGRGGKACYRSFLHLH